MNREVLEHIADAERAAHAGRWDAAFRGYVEAGDRCAELQLRRGAQRCFRRALEVDLLSTAALERLITVGRRLHASTAAWDRYLDAVPALAPLWTSANARLAQLVVDDDGAAVRHPAADGAIARVQMGEDRDVTVTRTARFAEIPDPMLLILLRRTLWLAPREQPEPLVPLRVALPDTATSYRLYENGDWD